MGEPTVADYAASVENERDRRIGETVASFRAQFARDRARLLRDLHTSAPAHAPAIIAALYRDAAVHSQWSHLYTRLFMDTGSQFAGRTAATLTETPNQAAGRVALAQYVARYVPRRVNAMLAATADRLIRELGRRQDTKATNTLDMAQTDEVIGDLFDSLERDGAPFLAEHETVLAGNAGMQYGVLSSEVGTEKQWLPMHDDHTRPTHAEMDGIIVGAREPFLVGDDYMMFPMDDSLGASMANIAGCRCLVWYSPAEAKRVSDQILTWKEWSEELHPRDEAGRFTDGGGGDDRVAAAQDASRKLCEAIGQRHEGDVETFEDAERVHAAAVTAIAARLEGNADFAAVCARFSDTGHVGYLGQASGEPFTVEQATEAMMRRWALSSDGYDGLAVAMQAAVYREFGLKGADVSNIPPQGYQNAEERYGDVIPGMRAFTRAMYDETQDWFAKQGITEVTLYRGMSWGGAYSPVDAPANLTFDEGAPSTVHEGTASMLPASSWSADISMATTFADHLDTDDPDRSATQHMLVQTTMPVSQVLSIQKTGWGTSYEAELVTLGKPVSATAITWTGTQPVDADAALRLLATGQTTAAKATPPEFGCLDASPYNTNWIRLLRQWRTGQTKDWSEDDHPRDERGRFTDSGGGDSSISQPGLWDAPGTVQGTLPGMNAGTGRTPQEEHADHVATIPDGGFKSGREAADWLSLYHPDTRFGLAGMDRRLATEFATEADRLFVEHAEAAATVKGMEVADMPPGDEHVVGQWDDTNGWMTLNRNYFESRDIMTEAVRQDVTSGFWPKQAAGHEATWTLSHEFGHVWSRWATTARVTGVDAQFRTGKAEKYIERGRVSHYGTIALRWGHPDEQFAEAFAMLQHGYTGRNSYVLAVRDYIAAKEAEVRK